MDTKYEGKIIKIYPYGFWVQTDNGEIGTLKKEVIPEDKIQDLNYGSKVVVIDGGRRSAKGRILWDWNDIPRNSFGKERNFVNSTQVNNSDEGPTEIPDENILSPLFKGKDRDLATTLLNDLFENLQSVNSERSYDLALSIIELNRCFKPLLLKDLNHKLYLKANKVFKIRMWKDRLIRYCNFQEVISLYKAQDPSIVEWLDTEFDFQNIIEKSTFVPPIVLDSNIEATLINKIESATNCIHVAVAWFTNPKLLKALLKALQHGCEVIVITNNDLINNGGYCLRLDDIIEAGGSIHLAEYPELVNHKFAIFDNNCVITGSYNWTIYAEHINRENALLIEGEGMESTISAYISIFNKLLEDFEKVDRMPESVPERPQYDRSSFKHYVTEEFLFLAKRTRSQEKRTSFYQKAIALSPNHPQIPTEYKSSATAQNVARRSSIRDEVKRLRDEEQSVSAKLNEKVGQIEQLKNQVQAIATSNPKAIEVSNINEQIAELSQNVDIDKRNLATIQVKQDLLQSATASELQGSNGKFRVNLEWNTIDDLDLHLIIPDGQEIYYGNKDVSSNGCQGHLDLDANAGAYTETPQENIYWDDNVPYGKYKINVHCYTYRSGASSIPFIITVFSDSNKPIIKTGIFSKKQSEDRQTKMVLEFEFTKDIGIKIL